MESSRLLRNIAHLSLLASAFFSHPARGDSPCQVHLEPKNGAASLVFVSDTQEPMWVERLWLRSDHNAEVTRELFRSIAREAPDAVFHGGDLVARGSSRSDWEKFHRAFEPVSRLGVPLYAVPGNHEYLFNSSRGRKFFEEEFPAFAGCSGQTVELGGVAVVLLNSNFSEMRKEEVERQDAWLEAELSRLDQDPKVGFVVLLAHHSPFTNGKVTGPSKEVQTHFVERYLAAKKTALMVTGHSHAFEHFRQGGKDFVVIGGGGGLLHPLRQGTRRLFDDLYPGDHDRGFFHYLKVDVVGGSLQATLMKYDSAAEGLKPDPAGFHCKISR